jgi:hypothetical protein
MPFTDASVFRRTAEVLEDAGQFPLQLGPGDGGALAEAARLMYLGYQRDTRSPEAMEAFHILNQVANRRGLGADREEFWTSVDQAYWTLGTICHSQGIPSEAAVRDTSVLSQDVADWIEDSLVDTVLPGQLAIKK